MREEQAAADYCQQADRAGALELAEVEAKLDHLSADEATHARELRRLLEGL